MSGDQHGPAYGHERVSDDGPPDHDRPDDYPTAPRAAWANNAAEVVAWAEARDADRPRRLADMVPDGLAVADECETGTGWTYCIHDDCTLCDCSCTCLDQRHCPRKATR